MFWLKLNTPGLSRVGYCKQVMIWKTFLSSKYVKIVTLTLHQKKSLISEEIFYGKIKRHY